MRPASEGLTHICLQAVQQRDTDLSGRDCDGNERTNTIGDRDRCAAGRARDLEIGEGETRGGKGGYTGGGRDGDNEACEGCAGLHRGLRDRRAACSRLRDDAAAELMDGLEAKGTEKRYLVLAATNRPWDVDIALRRAGRFDTTVFIPHPDLEARKRIFEIGLADKPCRVGVAEIAAMTDGYASAEIIDICEKAARIPLRERIKEGKPRREIVLADFERVIAERKTVLSGWYPKAVKELTGTEEAGMFLELVEAGGVHFGRVKVEGSLNINQHKV